MRSIPSALGLAALLAACAQTAPQAPTAALTAPLPDAALPESVVQFAMATGEGGVDLQTMTPGEAGIAFTLGEGCRWVNTEIFDPVAEWSGPDCTAAEGAQTVTPREGQLWPLQVGRTKSWDFQGRNVAGATWSGTRTCSVVAAETVRLEDREIDAFKVECDDPLRLSRSWFAPELGHIVYQTELAKRNNALTVRRLAPAEG